MTDTYDNNSSEESRMAVAELMVYAGHGMKSGYAGATGATSGNALNALKNYFGYTQKAYNVGHLNYTFQEWEDLFYNELAAGRPILMGADNYERTGGHELCATATTVRASTTSTGAGAVIRMATLFSP